MQNIRSNTIHYQALKAAYKRYIKTYKELNNGSVEGAINFFEFYYYINYTSRNSDPRSCVPLGYR
ncbi:MAG: hypothetical protein FJY29_13225 [Betaproteobacteria bacterium]|nr:hypothetical protein [Betaproteobacteria bacterium]